MIRLSVLALCFVGSAAIAGEARLAHVPAGKLPAMQAAAADGGCRAALVVPAGKINTYGHAAANPRCETTILAANQARPAPAAAGAGRD